MMNDEIIGTLAMEILDTLSNELRIFKRHLRTDNDGESRSRNADRSSKDE